MNIKVVFNAEKMDFNLLIQNLNENVYLKTSLYILLSVLAGMVFHQIVIQRLKKLSKKTKWAWDDIVIKSMGKIAILLFLLGGTYFAILDSGLEATYKQISYEIIFISFVIAIALVVTRMSAGFIKLYALRTHGGLPATSIFNVLAKILIYTLALLVILQTFGISITPLLTALGVGGLAVALALQDTLGNLFAGIHLIASKKFKPGDYVEMDTVNSGFIDDISWRNTTIRTMSNNLIIIPNSKISSAIVTNYSRPRKELSVLISGGVSYNSDLEKVEKVIKDVAIEILKKIEGGVQEFEPLIRFSEFGDSSINFVTILRAQEFTNQYLLKHEFIKALHKKFKEENIEIPFPQMDVHMSK